MDKNEKTIFQHDIEVPPIVMEKANAAFLTIEKEGWNIMRENKSVKMGRVVKATAAVAACAALLVAAGAAAGGFVGGDVPVTEVADQSGVSAGGGLGGGKGIPTADGSAGGKENPTAESTAKDGFQTVEPTFSLAAYAPEGVKAGMSGDDLVFTDIGTGEGGFTGMLFQVQGDGIADVDIKIDKGELYTTTIEETTEDVIYDIAAAGMPDEDGDPDTHTVYSLIGDYDPNEKPEDHKPCDVIAYHCTKAGTQVSGAYDAGLYYGFYIPDDVTSSKYDLAEAYREQLGVFEGSTLRVSVTYTDGSSASKAYALSVKKLALDAQRNVTQTEWKENDPDMKEGYVYGVMATEKE